MTRRPKRPGPGARRRAVLYLRVSTSDQAEHGVSLADQRARLLAWATAAGCDVVAVEADAGVSGATLERPALTRALDLLRRGRADLLAVVSLSRLTRSVRDLGALLEEHFGDRGSGLVSLSEAVDTSTPGGKLVLHVLGAVSEWERSATAERTSHAMRHMRREGKYTGGIAPYGFALAPDGALVEVEPEQETIRRARELRDGGASLRAIAATLATEGHLSRNGRPFEPSAIRRMLIGSAPRAGAAA